MKNTIIILSSLLLVSCTNIGTQITNKSGTVQLVSTASNSTTTPPVCNPNPKPLIKSNPKPEVVAEVEITTISRRVIDSRVVIQ